MAKTSQRSENQKLNGIIQMLIGSIKTSDKKGILNAYELAKSVNLDVVDDKIFETYDLLVGEANEVLIN